MSDKPVSVDSKLVQPFERPKDTVCKSKEQATKMRKEKIASEKMVERAKVTAEAARVCEAQKTESPRDKKDPKSEVFGEILKVRDVQSTEFVKEKKDIQKPAVQKLEVSSNVPKIQGTQKKMMESPKDAKDAKNVKPISTKAPEERSDEDTKADEAVSKLKTIPILEKVSFFYSHKYLVSK